MISHCEIQMKGQLNSNKTKVDSKGHYVLL